MTSSRRSPKKHKGAAWIGIIVVTAGIFGTIYMWQPWDESWFPTQEASAKMKEPTKADSKEPVLKIQNVLEIKTEPVVQVVGAVKLTLSDKKLFDQLNGLEIKPETRFSLNEWYEGVKSTTGVVTETNYSYLASLLYEGAVHLGFQTGERQLHEKFPAYAHLGFDVFAKPDGNDLTLYNPSKLSVVVKVNEEAGKPKLVFEADETADWKDITPQITKKDFNPERLTIVDKSLAPGNQVTRSQGAKGLEVKVVAQGVTLSTDFYLPDPIVIAEGPKIKDPPNDIGFEEIVDVGIVE